MSARTVILILTAAACADTPAEQRSAADVELEPVAVLGSADDSISIHGLAQVIEIESGDFLVIGSPFPRDRILRYSPRGKLLGTVGKPGAGPGEFRSISSIRRTADSVVVFEMTGNVSSISSDLSVHRLTTIRGLVQRGWVSPQGQLFVMGTVPGHQKAPIYRFAGAELIAGFGRSDSAASRDRPSLMQRHAAFTDDGQMWLLRPDRYELELYDSTGSLVRRIDRDVSWFPDRDYELSAPPAPPSPFLIDVAVDSSGHLLVLGHVPNSPFNPNLPRGEGVDLTPGYMTQLYDGMLEVLDPATNAVLFSHRSDIPFAGFAAPDKVYTLSEDDRGTVVIQVWRLRFKLPD